MDHRGSAYRPILLGFDEIIEEDDQARATRVLLERLQAQTRVTRGMVGISTERGPRAWMKTLQAYHEADREAPETGHPSPDTGKSVQESDQ